MLKIMDSKIGVSLVCTVYDLAAQQHGPLFMAVNLPIMWRNVDHLLAEAVSPKSEFVVFVHGEFEVASKGTAFSPYLEPSIYTVEDRGLVSAVGISRLVDDVKGAYSGR